MDATLLKHFVSEFFDLLGVETTSVDVTDGHRTVVAVVIPEPARLLGADGENLRALNSIARRMVEHKYGEEAAGFLIDINGHHEAQMEKVRANARMLAQRVRLFKHDVDLEPMSAYERLVVHELFASDPEIETQSAGEGKFRHIVLKHKNSAATA